MVRLVRVESGPGVRFAEVAVARTRSCAGGDADHARVAVVVHSGNEDGAFA